LLPFPDDPFLFFFFFFFFFFLALTFGRLLDHSSYVYSMFSGWLDGLLIVCLCLCRRNPQQAAAAALVVVVQSIGIHVTAVLVDEFCWRYLSNLCVSICTCKIVSLS
jgi:hypothetical protein